TESFLTYFKKTKERERDYGLALANNSSEENRDRDSSSGVSSEETMREDEDETQVQSTLIRLHEAGEIPSGDVTKFYKAARGFLLRSKEYALKKLPLNDPLLPHAEFVDFRQYKHLLPFEDPREQDRISDEFLEYQMLEETDIPDMVWKSALESVGEEEQFHCMAMVWAHLTTQKSRVTGKEQFPRLGK
ncbi:GTPase Era, partial [Dissostichus eleginoides]